MKFEGRYPCITMYDFREALNFKSGYGFPRESVILIEIVVLESFEIFHD